MSNEEKRVISGNLDEYVFGDTTLDIPMTIAPTGEHRSEGYTKDMIVRVNMQGVTLKEALAKTAAQLSVNYKTPRRLEESNGVFPDQESWDEWYENTGGEEHVRYADVGKAPQPPKSDAELEQESELAFEEMSPEAQQAHIRKLQERLAKQQA